MFRPPFASLSHSIGFLRRAAALSVVAATLLVPATSAAAAGCGPLDYFCTNPTPKPILPVAQQLVVNSSFEDNTPQTTPPHPGWIKSENALFVTSPHHYGSQSLEDDLGVFGALSAGPPTAYAFQDVFVPAGASQPVLRYYLDVQTSLTGSTAIDTLRVTVGNPPSTSFPPILVIPTTVAQYSNLNNTRGGWCRKGDFDLSGFRGQTVRLMFLATINSVAPFNAAGSTRFFVDDVELWTEAPFSIVGPAC